MAPRNNHREEDDRSTQGEIDLRVLGRGMWRRKRWILLPTLLVAIAAILFVQLTAPYYRSSALVLIENREGGAPRAGGDAAAPLPDEQAVASQVQLIQSRDLVRTVV
ncbi:MAG: Wzz/FepE/Etk N-terminal domain-containing protein, partial [Hansschlegelia sp.]